MYIPPSHGVCVASMARGVYESPAKHKAGNEQKGKSQMLSQTQHRKFCSDFSKEDYRCEIEAHSLIDSTNIWRAPLLCWSPMLLLWLQA